MNLSRRLAPLLLLALVACAPTATTGGSAPSVATQAPAPAPAQPTARPALSGNLTVFAAASLTDAFNDAATQFKAANPQVNITFNFAGSQALRTQMEQGARADVFASANIEQMDLAVKNGVVNTGVAKNFAANKVTIIVPKDNPAKITTPADLQKPGIKLVIANKDVPVGNYTREILGKMSANPQFGAGFTDAVMKNVVSEENDVKQVVAKVQLGEADAGVVYTTDITPQVSGSVQQVVIPDNFNVIASYPIARTKEAQATALADAFIAFILSADGQAVLKKYGFLPPV